MRRTVMQVLPGAPIVLLLGMSAWGGDEPLFPGDDPWPAELSTESLWGEGLFGGIRAGAWFVGEFDAVVPTGVREIGREGLVEIGADLGYAYRSLSLYVTADYAASSDVEVLLGGISVGWTAEIPRYDILLLEYFEGLSAHLGAGAIAGTFEVSESGFGDFEDGVGFQGRIAFGVPLGESTRLDFWVDYRDIQFDYEGGVIKGDEHAVGSSFAVGGGLVLRF